MSLINNLKLVKKHWVSVVLFLLIVIIYSLFKCESILRWGFFGYYFSMIYYWRLEVVEKIKKTWKLRREIRDREYFYIIEDNNVTDIIKRRSLGEAVLFIMSGVCFTVMLLLNSIPIEYFNLFGDIIVVFLTGVACLLVVALILHFRYYWTSVYYLLIPFIVTTLVLINEEAGIADLHKTTFILKSFIYLGITYAILTLLLPIPYLRKISQKTFLVGTVLSIIIPAVTEYIWLDSLLAEVNQGLQVQQMILESGLSSELIFFLNTPEVLQILTELKNLLFPIIVKEQFDMVSVFSFLWLSGYTIGSMIIGIKLKLGDSKARDIYDKIILSEDEVCYSDLRDIIFYGDELYRYRIMDKSQYRILINTYESSKVFSKIQYNWSINILKYCRFGFVKLLKKLI